MIGMLVQRSLSGSVADSDLQHNVQEGCTKISLILRVMPQYPYVHCRFLGSSRTSGIHSTPFGISFLKPTPSNAGISALGYNQGIGAGAVGLG
jgi:hypothetical protein